MLLRIAGIAVVCGLAGATVAATEFWEKKDFTAWTDREIQTLLTNSPWSRTFKIGIVDSSLANRVGGLFGGVVGAGTGSRRTGGGVGGDGSGNMGGGSFLPSPVTATLALRWTSALPVKQAMLRRRATPDAALGEASLTENDAHYRLAVDGVSRQVAAQTGDLLEATSLGRRNAGAVHPVNIDIAVVDDHLIVEFKFPRTEAITVDDQEVEFVTMLGGVAVKKKFQLKDMMFHGKLAL